MGLCAAIEPTKAVKARAHDIVQSPEAEEAGAEPQAGIARQHRLWRRQQPSL